MYAVIKTGGKQYRVAEGDKLKVEKLEAEEGASVDLDQVLMVADGDDVRIGTPFVDGGCVTATVTGHGRHDKIEVVKFKRRKKYHRFQGHRQYFTELQVTAISPSATAAAEPAAVEAPADEVPSEPTGE